MLAAFVVSRHRKPMALFSLLVGIILTVRLSPFFLTNLILPGCSSGPFPRFSLRVPSYPLFAPPCPLISLFLNRGLGLWSSPPFKNGSFPVPVILNPFLPTLADWQPQEVFFSFFLCERMLLEGPWQFFGSPFFFNLSFSEGLVGSFQHLIVLFSLAEVAQARFGVLSSSEQSFPVFPMRPSPVVFPSPP